VWLVQENPPPRSQDDDRSLSGTLRELGAVESAAQRYLGAADRAVKVESDFGTRVREARQLLGMTQRELAFEVGLDASAISRLEQGSRAIRLGEAMLIADALKLDVRQLVYGKLSNDPLLELYGACDELERATAQLRNATYEAEQSVGRLKTVLEIPAVREYLAASPVDVDKVIGMCSRLPELFFEHDHARLLGLIHAELLDMHESNIRCDDPDA
jgi:transcriptional regulator with XRE-family HTH domain